MKAYAFTLQVPQENARHLTIGWLLLALASLVIGGLFTILIVLSRTPFFNEIIPWIDFFHTALVVHVDMTVVVWFLAFAGVFWSLITYRHFFWRWLALFLCVVGTLVISVAPFLGDGHPLMNNYVPVLQIPIFFVGLGIFGVGFTILVVFSFISSFTSSQREREQNSSHVSTSSTTGERGENQAIEDQARGEKALRFGIFTALLTALIAIIALIWSYVGIPSDKIGGQYYYELLFWGSGHIIQFTHTQLMLVAWLWLATISGAVLYINPRVVIFLFALGAAPTLLTPFIYLTYDVTSPNHIINFTWLMQYGGGLAALPFGLIIALGILKSKPVPTSFRAEKAALIFSILLFGVGGIIGFLISGSNVTVPAHYHGSIVGVTLAFMGLTYYLMPRLGFREISGKWAQWQPTIYGTGQLMHVLGLAWSGGYGVQRKTAGAAQGLEGLQQQLGMGLMGLGGMIAIIGGIIFLVVVFLAMRPQR